MCECTCTTSTCGAGMANARVRCRRRCGRSRRCRRPRSRRGRTVNLSGADSGGAGAARSAVFLGSRRRRSVLTGPNKTPTTPANAPAAGASRCASPLPTTPDERRGRYRVGSTSTSRPHPRRPAAMRARPTSRPLVRVSVAPTSVTLEASNGTRVRRDRDERAEHSSVTWPVDGSWAVTPTSATSPRRLLRGTRRRAAAGAVTVTASSISRIRTRSRVQPRSRSLPPRFLRLCSSPPPSPSPETQSSGGGGGGAAMDLLALLCVLAVLAGSRAGARPKAE